MGQRNARLTARAWSRSSGIAERQLIDAIHSGELVAYRPGKRKYLILQEDFEAWLETKRIRPRS